PGMRGCRTSSSRSVWLSISDAGPHGVVRRSTGPGARAASRIRSTTLRSGLREALMPGDYEDLYDLENLDDDELASLILEELGEYPEIDPDAIDVDVQDGFVTLTGRVGTEYELQVVEQVLSDVLGIANYSNELVVDELARIEYLAGADDAVAEDEEIEAQYGEEGRRTEPTAEHLLEDVAGQAYGTHDYQRALETGETYEAPDRPIQEGSWSEENH